MAPRRVFLLVLVLYFFLDFANPLMPGAVRFGDDSIDAIRAEQWKSIAAKVPVLPADRHEPVPRPPDMPGVVTAPTRGGRPHPPRFFVPARRALIAPVDSAQHAPDH